MASIEITMRHSDVRIEALKDYAQQRMEKLCAAYPKVTKVTCVIDIDVKPHVLSYDVTEEGECAVLSIQLPAGNDVNINPNILLKGFESVIGKEFDQCDIVRERILTESGEDFR